MNKRFFKIFIIIIFIASLSLIVFMNSRYLNIYQNKNKDHINSEEENESYPFIKESEKKIGIPHEDSNDDSNNEKDDLEYEIIELS